jgi:hypothetical protein
MDLWKLNTGELRDLCRDRCAKEGIQSSWVHSADKAAKIAYIEDGTLPGGVAAPAKPAADSADLADVIARAVSGRVKAGVDEYRVREIVREEIEESGAGGWSINLPEIEGGPVEIDGLVHRQYPQILTWLRANVPVWLWGAPGAGKTHLARQLAQALSVEPYVMSIDETTTANKLLGFQNLVSGEYVKGWLYRPYKEGGLVLIDEIDTGNPGIIAGLNALLANDHYMFPNGETVDRNPNFRVVAAANTNGTGAVAGFTARQRLDAATLNRFAVVEFVYDEGLELALAIGGKSDSAPWTPVEPADASQCRTWVEWVQKVRAEVGKSVLVSPRASLLGVRALRAGIPAFEVANALVLALCASDTRRRIIDKCGNPADLVGQARRAA